MYHDSPLAADDWQSRLSCHAALATLAAKLNNYTGTKVLATYKLKAFAILPVKFAGSLGLCSGLAHLGLVCGEPTAGQMTSQSSQLSLRALQVGAQPTCSPPNQEMD